MKNIVLCCAAGMSTSMLVQRMKDACSAAKFFAPKRIKLCTAATERNTDIAHSAN